MDEQNILQLLHERKETAIIELSKLYGSKCTSIALGILKNKEDAEECINDAYLAVWNSIPPETPKSLGAYLYSIVRNFSLMKYRYNTAEKRNSHYDAALDELEDSLKSIDEVWNNIAAKELAILINHFLEKQKKLDRIIFIKRYWFSMEPQEIAKEMKLTKNNINVHLHRTREKLKLYLMKEGYHEE